MCIRWCIIGMPNKKVINIMVIEILQKRSNFDISLLGVGLHMWQNHLSLIVNWWKVGIFPFNYIITITRSKYNSHTGLNVVKDIFQLQILKFYCKFKNGLLPHYLQSLPLQYDQGSHNTQSCKKIHQFVTNNEYNKKCIRNK